MKLVNKKAHWLSRSPTYSTWRSMLGRCSYPSTNGYHNYGGRGITVCPEWMKFENFIRDMGERPEGHVIDRIDNDRGYFKANCRWVTKIQSARNRRAVKIPFIEGEAAKARRLKVHRDWVQRNLTHRTEYLKNYEKTRDKQHRYKIHRAWRLNHMAQRRAAGRKYYAAHKELAKQRHHEWRSKNKSYLSRKATEYRLKNRERIKQWMKEYHKRYYPLNRERLLAQTKAYAKAHPEIRKKIALNAKLKAKR